MHLILLGGCGQSGISSDVESGTSNNLTEENPSELDTVEPTDVETEESEESEDSEGTVSEQLSDEQSEQSSPPQPFIENGFGRSIYETPPYLTIGEQISIANNEIEVGTVSLDRYDIIEDELGSGRKGLLLWLTETNTSNEPLQVGLYGLNTLSSINVFYGELELKRLSHATPLEKIEGEDYINNYHVEYTPTTPELDSCVETVELQPGESRVCYQTYSYAGPGEYLISQPIDNHYSSYKNYLLKIE